MQYNSHNLTSVIYLHIICSIWNIDMNLSGATTPGLSESASNGNEGVLQTPLISKAEASPSGRLMSYPVLLGEFYSSAEMQSVYSTAPAKWAYLPCFIYHQCGLNLVNALLG